MPTPHTGTRGRRGRAVLLALFALPLVLALPAAGVQASSHREAPAITESPKVDTTDFYMFRSYEPGREGYVTLISNYIPLQEPGGGPNYFTFDENAVYEIHIDNDGDAVEDITFRFDFERILNDIQIPVGPAGDQKMVSVPLRNVGPISTGDETNLNVIEQYTVDMITGDRRTGQVQRLMRSGSMDTTFRKPPDNIGTKSFPDYATYADQFIYDFDIPGSNEAGRVFVGQREESFYIDLGGAFDLFNLNPLGAEDGGDNDLANYNITTIAIEVPISVLTNPNATPSDVIGSWASASRPQVRVLNPDATDAKPHVDGGAYTQVSRLGNPLVNELVIGIKDKNRFNAAEPKDDAQFLDYVTNPTLPELIEILFGVTAPNAFPRNDLVAAFLTGVPGLNDFENGTPGEMLRLNTSIPAGLPAAQNPLGVIAGDFAGFPNGRRPGDDVVDIALRVFMGVLLDPSVAPDGQLSYNDGVRRDATEFRSTFPYLNAPIPGATSGN